MSPVIILGLVLMWAVVLIPMWLRRHDEVEESRSVDRFTAAMHTLSRHEGRPVQRNLKSARSGSGQGIPVQRPAAVLDVHVSGASAPEAKAARRRRQQAVRRTRVLALLLVTDLGVLVGAVVAGGPLLWALQVVLDLGAIFFVAHLRHMAQLAAASRRRAATRRRDNALLDELEREPVYETYASPAPEWEEGVTVFRAGSTSARTQQLAADAVFDQTALVDEPEIDDRLAADFDEAIAVAAPVAAPAAAYRSARSDGFFDQETDLSTVATPRKSFIETGPIPSRAAEVAQRAERAARAAAAAAAAAAEAEAVGGKPWEPVPVPRPTYAMKPAVTPQPARSPQRNESLLPPVDRAVELESEDDLEAILDRRWAVND